ncbi:hypothetical protein IFM89_013740 [Coptis chinensis]|uniref:PITH domain-containing protein n=1 Tax=Coptis chinensis TaxID=261450 RepID=A0A835HSG9_9MAGN|nr:hypothetical protein IFM89_013740 [Coptis chinensis]
MSTESSSAIYRNQVDLLDFIDWTGVECLNQKPNHSIVNALKQILSGAMTVKLFANKEHMGFSNVNDFPPSDTVVFSPDNLKSRDNRHERVEEDRGPQPLKN